MHRLLEKLTDQFYEGPEPPKRLPEKVKLFRLYYPHADADEWAAFANRIARNSYKDGFIRGYEWQERDWPGPELEPERVAELTEQDWSLAEESREWSKLLEKGYDPRSPLANLSPEQRRAVVETFQGASRYPVEVNLSAYEEEPEDEPG